MNSKFIEKIFIKIFGVVFNGDNGLFDRYQWLKDNLITPKENSNLLDVGCGIGITTKKLLDDGFYIDGLVPYKWMADYAKNLTQKYLKKYYH